MGDIHPSRRRDSDLIGLTSFAGQLGPDGLAVLGGIDIPRARHHRQRASAVGRLPDQGVPVLQIEGHANKPPEVRVVIDDQRPERAPDLSRAAQTDCSMPESAAPRTRTSDRNQLRSGSPSVPRGPPVFGVATHPSCTLGRRRVHRARRGLQLIDPTTGHSGWCGRGQGGHESMDRRQRPIVVGAVRLQRHPLRRAEAGIGWTWRASRPVI
jgi:hypothetical protein